MDDVAEVGTVDSATFDSRGAGVTIEFGLLGDTEAGAHIDVSSLPFPIRNAIEVAVACDATATALDTAGALEVVGANLAIAGSLRREPLTSVMRERSNPLRFRYPHIVLDPHSILRRHVIRNVSQVPIARSYSNFEESFLLTCPSLRNVHRDCLCRCVGLLLPGVDPWNIPNGSSLPR